MPSVGSNRNFYTCAWIDHLGHENPRHTPQRDAQAIHARILRVGYLIIGSDPDENFVKRQSVWPEDRQLFNIDVSIRPAPQAQSIR